MKSQLYQVFRTYWNRPMVLLFAALIPIFLATGIYYQTATQKNISLEPQLQRPAVSERTDSIQWKSFLRDKNLREIRSLYLNISLDFDLDLNLGDGVDMTGNITGLDKLSNLESLHLRTWKINPELQQQIQSLKKLTSLTLYAYDAKKGLEVPEEFFKTVGPQLRELNIGQIHFDQLKGTEHLVNLELLIIAEKDLAPESIKAINQLPHLKILVIDSLPCPELSRISAELLLALKDHPSLERIYASWPPYGFHGMNEETLRSIQMLPLHYSNYSQGKVAAIQVTLFAMLFVLHFRGNFALR